MTVSIAPESPASADGRLLIGELDAEIEPLYARASRHGYSVDQLLAENVDFFILREDGVPAGCGGVKRVIGEYAELKRMFVRAPFRGRGLSRLLLDHLTGFARDDGFAVLRLETGIHQKAATGLYESARFVRIPPFGSYFDDPVSLCYEKRLR
jgi:GNAT superfamily N-acetyltransferase